MDKEFDSIRKSIYAGIDYKGEFPNDRIGPIISIEKAITKAKEYSRLDIAAELLEELGEIEYADPDRMPDWYLSRFNESFKILCDINSLEKAAKLYISLNERDIRKKSWMDKRFFGDVNDLRDTINDLDYPVKNKIFNHSLKKIKKITNPYSRISVLSNLSSDFSRQLESEDITDALIYFIEEKWDVPITFHDWDKIFYKDALSNKDLSRLISTLEEKVDEIIEETHGKFKDDKFIKIYLTYYYLSRRLETHLNEKFYERIFDEVKRYYNKKDYHQFWFPLIHDNLEFISEHLEHILNYLNTYDSELYSYAKDTILEIKDKEKGRR